MQTLPLMTEATQVNKALMIPIADGGAICNFKKYKYR